jgi:hypothetical protein
MFASHSGVMRRSCTGVQNLRAQILYAGGEEEAFFSNLIDLFKIVDSNSEQTTFLRLINTLQHSKAPLPVIRGPFTAFEHARRICARGKYKLNILFFVFEIFEIQKMTPFFKIF